MTVIQNLLDVILIVSPGYNVDWDQILGGMAREPSEDKARLARAPSEDDAWESSTAFCFLIRCSIETHINAIGVKHF